MIEGFAREMPEDQMAEAILEAHRTSARLCDLQEELCQKVQRREAELRAAARRRPVRPAQERYYDAFKQAKQHRGQASPRRGGQGAQGAKSIAEIDSRSEGGGRGLAGGQVGTAPGTRWKSASSAT